MKANHSEAMRTQNKSCPSCGGHDLTNFYRVDNVPVHSVLLMESREQALNYPTGTLDLAFCEACGFIFNMAFDPDVMEYCSRYEETQGYSETFRAFHRGLAERLNARHQLAGKTVIEIGCGKGEFLTLLCETTGARGVGFDPSYVPERNTSSAGLNIEFIKDFYSEKYGSYSADLVCCKMTLEHIPEVRKFVETVGASLAQAPQATIFFQLPDATKVLRDLAFWDVYYEHCSYFTAGSLARLFRRCGLEPFESRSEYDGQYVMIEAHAPGGKTPELEAERDLAAIRADVERFRAGIADRLSQWRGFARGAAARGEKTVLWGGGSKAVAFLTTLGIQSEIEFAVDINPHRQNTYLAGSGQRIVSPGFLTEYRPDNVILMNPVYLDEVRMSLSELGLFPRLFTCDSIAPQRQTGREMPAVAEPLGAATGETR